MKKDICSTQDYLVSGETFSIRWDESKGFAATYPQPDADKLGLYYESDAYISHNESQQSVVGFLYRFARRYMFRVKHKMFKKLLPADATILDYGCGTGILGIASKKVFKKSKVIFVDIDEDAVKLSKKNIELNHIKVNGVYLTNSFFETKYIKNIKRYGDVNPSLFRRDI